MTSPGPSARGRRPGGAGRDGGIDAVKAFALIAVLVIVGIAVLARTGKPARVATAGAATRHSTTTSPAEATTTTTVLAPSQVKVQVLNGLRTGTLASQWTKKLAANPGYSTLPGLDATSKVTASAIYMITSGYQSEANALAAAVGLPATAVNSTVPPPASAPIPTSVLSSGANLVLVIGPELASSA